MNIQFKNKENKLHIIDGSQMWHSRSVATGAVILMAIFNNKILKPHTFKVLLELRSDIVEEPNKWCNPCGYLDWNETLEECVIREIYEETGLYLPKYENHLAFKTEMPFYINSNIENSRQNIHIYYGFLYGENKNFTKDLVFSNHEIKKLEWVDTDDLDKLKFARNHREAINIFIEKYIKNNA